MDNASVHQKDLLLNITFFGGIVIGVINATLVINLMKEISNLNLVITGIKVGAIFVILLYLLFGIYSGFLKTIFILIYFLGWY